MKNRFEIFEIEADKANHFFYGSFIVFLVFMLTYSETISFLVCIVIAILKEIYDHFFGSKFDWMDIIWTILGGSIIFIRLL
jgi:hypothetical protein